MTEHEACLKEAHEIAKRIAAGSDYREETVYRRVLENIIKQFFEKE